MANLSPELLARIQAYYAQPASGSGWSPNMATPFSEGGRMYQSDAQQGWGQDGGGATGMTSLFEYDPNKTQAGQDKFNVYDPQGTFLNEGTFKTDDAGKMLALALAAAGGMSMLGAGAGYGASGLTEPVASIGATGGLTEAELAAMGASGAGGAGGAATFNAAADSQLANAAIDAAGGNSLAGYQVAGISPAVQAGSGLLSGASKLLGPAATLLGAAAGAKGQKTEQTSERKTDPRVDPYLFGANGQPGLLQMTYDKLAGQMAPGGLQGYDDMQRVGRGLLNTPVAGNGFGLFGRIR